MAKSCAIVELFRLPFVMESLTQQGWRVFDAVCQKFGIHTNGIDYDELLCTQYVRVVNGELYLLEGKEFVDEQELVEYVRSLGGHLYRVGGSVRDEAVGLKPHDYDYVVICNEDDMECFNPLAAFRAARQAVVMSHRTDRLFSLDKETLLIMSECSPEESPQHRINYELRDVEIIRGRERFFSILSQAGISVRIHEDEYGYRTFDVSVSEQVHRSLEQELFGDSLPERVPMWA